MSRTLRISRGLMLGSLAAAVCVALRPLLSLDRVPVFRDLLLFIVPIKYFLAEHLRRGEVPFWNPWISLGSPFLAAMHMGVFYPPSALLLLPLPVGFNLFLLAHYLIAVTGMWKFLRERGLGPASAALGSLTFAVGGYAISLLNIPKELHGAAWLPWALFFWTRWLRRGSRRDLALTALSLALQILGGSVESMLMTVALLGAFGLHAKIPKFGAMLRAAIALVIVVGAACALTSFQLLPTLEYAAQSGRAKPLTESEVFHWSLRPVSLLQLLVPISATSAGVPSLGIGLEPEPPMLESIYLGIPALCLVFAGLTGSPERRFWGLVLGGSLVAALGASTPLLPLLYRTAPELFGRLRYPEKFVLLAHVSAAVLAADGLARLERERQGVPLGAAVAGALLLLVGVGLWWLVRHQPRMYLAGLAWAGGRTPTAIVPVAEALAAQVGRLSLLSAGLVSVLLLARAALIDKRLACLALVLLEAGDLVSVRWRSLVTMSWSRVRATKIRLDVGELRESGQRIFHYTDAPADPSSIGRFRLEPIHGSDPVSQYLIPWSTLFANVPMVYGVHSVGGSDGFVRSDMRTFLDVLPTLSLDGAIRVVRAMGVSYMIGPSARASPLLEPVEPGEGLRPFIYRTRDPAPFVRLAERLDVEKSEASALARLAQDDFDPGREAVVAELPEGWKDGGGAGGPAGTAKAVARKDEVVEIHVRAPGERLLVINQSDYPGWHATIDGHSAGILRANGLLQGVPVPPGEHVVVLRFRPTGFGWGCATAALTALGLLAFVGTESWGRTSSA